MSVEELLRSYEDTRILGYSLNINCGYLRRIGKTECLRRIIRLKPISIRGILLLPSQNFVRNWVEETRDYNISCYVCPNVYPRFNSQLNSQLSSSSPQYVYSDEVPDAETIVRNWGRQNIEFIAGFFSVHRSQNLQGVTGVSFQGLTGLQGVTGPSFQVQGVTGPSFQGVTGVSFQGVTGMHANFANFQDDNQELQSIVAESKLTKNKKELPKDQQNKIKFIIKEIKPKKQNLLNQFRDPLINLFRIKNDDSKGPRINNKFKTIKTY